MRPVLEAAVERDGDRVRLVSPDVGLFTEAPRPGTLVGAGQPIGTLRRLGQDAALVAPEGVAGRVVSPLPPRVAQPVGCGDLLVELAPLALDGIADGDGHATSQGEHALVLPSPQSGRFYHRPGPDDPAFATPGDVLEDGRPIGLIEVMKTFAHVPYHGGGGRPARARLLAYLCPDGAEVAEGEALIEIEPA